jgi:hypothetical protein
VPDVLCVSSENLFFGSFFITCEVILAQCYSQGVTVSDFFFKKKKVPETLWPDGVAAKNHAT